MGEGILEVYGLTGEDRLLEQKKLDLLSYLLELEGDKILSTPTSRKQSLDDLIGIMGSY